MSKLTRTGARLLTAELDRIASAVQHECEILGLPPKIAMDFARRCDLMSDSIERQAIKNFPKTAFDAEIIGEEQAGPILEVDSEEPFMDGHFTQEWFDELETAQESNALPKGFETPAAKTASKNRK